MSKLPKFSYGSLVQINFADTVKSSSDPIDPTTLTLTLTNNLGSETITYNDETGTSPVIVRTGVGVYYANVSLDVTGPWSYYWQAYGTGQGGGGGQFDVSTPSVLN